MSARYYLHKRSDAGREKRLRLIVYRGGRQIPVTLPFAVLASDWSQKQQKVKASAAGGYRDGDPVHVTELNEELARIRMEAHALTLAHRDDDDLKAAILDRLGRAPAVPEPTLLEHYEAFLKHRQTRVKASTLQVFHALKEHLQTFMSGKRLTAGDVDSGMLEDFLTFLLGTGLNNNSSNKYATRLRTFFAWLHERGHLESVPKAKRLKTAQGHVLRLTLEELASLQSVDLSNAQPGYRAAREMFLLCVYTGQRISDVSRMEWKDIQGDAWYLTEQKTNVVRRVPLLAPSLEIIERHRGERRPVPRLSEQKCNDYIKAVAKLAGIDAPVTLRSQKGGKVETKTVPKHEAISTHVGRKTFVSLMMEHGVSAKEMLGITHGDLRSLRQYAGASEDHLRKAMTSVFQPLKPVSINNG